jgi:hypothetical protein
MLENNEELAATRPPLQYACSGKSSTGTTRSKKDAYLVRQGRDRAGEQASQNLPESAAERYLPRQEPFMENLLEDEDCIPAYPRSLLERQMTSKSNLREEEEDEDDGVSPSSSPRSLFQNT